MPGADGSVLNVLQLVSGQAAERRQHEELQSRLDRAVREAQRRAEGKLRSVERQMSQAAEHESVAHVGELLAANIWRMELGMRSIEGEGCGSWGCSAKLAFPNLPRCAGGVACDAVLREVECRYQTARSGRLDDRGEGDVGVGPVVEAA